MAKTKEVYVCRECGYETPKWNGRCPACDEWNTFEQQVQVVQQAGKAGRVGTVLPSERPVKITEVDTAAEVRYHTGVKELDRVLGGGIVQGAIMLLSGDPGVGKSTMLLQICEFLCAEKTVLYVSGEESVRQLKLRAQRLGVQSENLSVVSLTDVEGIIHTVETMHPDFVMIDSIQTMTLSGLTSSAGSVTQVRESTSAFMRMAKSMDIPVFLVGHVNKDGAIAGPKVLEHIVDTVLYFEGDRHLSYRILRAVKNRYGSTNEIGVFEMRDNGLFEVENPSAMLLSGRPAGVSGTCVACAMEGSRPIMVEVQALVTKSGFGTPRRMSAGFDYNRASLLIAVLEKRAGFFFGALDTYINIVGGLKLEEPAADLSVALALVSSLLDKIIGEELIAFGELGLAGEIRNVSHIPQRIREAKRLGFTQCIVPYSALKQIEPMDGMELIGVKSIRQAVQTVFGT